jgi:hypothetical protein
MRVSIPTNITPITARRVRAGLQRTVERLHEARDPLGLQDVDVVRQSADEPNPFEVLVDAMLPIVPNMGTANQAVRNAAARREFLAEFPTLTSAAVAQASGSTARNSAALATRWRTERRVFAVAWGGEVRYPAFQFDDDGIPLPVIKLVLGVLGHVASGWQVALWFSTPSPHLPRHERPVQFLWDAEQLVAAAHAERELPEF